MSLCPLSFQTDLGSDSRRIKGVMGLVTIRQPSVAARASVLSDEEDERRHWVAFLLEAQKRTDRIGEE